MENKYKNHVREEYKKRNNFTDSDYYKIVTFSMKLYRQAVSTGIDMEGNSFSKEEIALASGLVDRMTKEIALAKENFEKEQRDL